MTRPRALLIYGTRPEAVKMAPVVHECRRRDGEIEALVCVTGQHREMLRSVDEYFGIVPDVDLDLMAPSQTLAGLTARCVERTDEVLERLRPDWVVAQGDTTTVMCAALAAFYRRIPFAHVEAGLRTGDVLSPWPEELNRRVAGLSARLHCAPTAGSRDNLLREGVPPQQVHVTGNTVIDALLGTVERERRNGERWRAKFDFLGERPLVLITGHRRENFGAGFEGICRAIATLAERFPGTEFVYPVHLNPNVQQPVRAVLSNRPNVHLLPPSPYPEFVWLMDRSTVLLTDSGGVQEEAPSLQKPVVVMRESTERPEAADAGAALLVGTDPERIVSVVARLLTDESERARCRVAVNPYGDGCAARRIVDLLLGRSVEPFSPLPVPQRVG